jgi:F-type H+-transporting ATPase subunit gamma
VLFYLVGRKGRAVIQRAYPEHRRSSTPPTCAKPGYAEAERIATNCRAVRRRQVRRRPPVLRALPFGAGAGTDRAADHPACRRPKDTPLSLTAPSNTSPTRKLILAALLPRYLRPSSSARCSKTQASEQGASMTAMDNATRNAGDLINKLTIQYNRSRQAAITTELIEIIAGAEAL